MLTGYQWASFLILVSLCTYMCIDGVKTLTSSVHALSYALKDIHVQYIPPISISQNVGAFPLGWKKPEMPNAAKFKVSLL
mgnify:CR=1 FL=1